MTAEASTSKKTVLTCDIQAAQHFAAADLEKERDLMTQCWWDYRGLHPVRRTEYFAKEYARIYRRYMAKYVNSATAEYGGGFSGSESIFKLDHHNEKVKRARRTNLTGFWRARQAADELGIKYSVYISSIFEFAFTKGFVNLKMQKRKDGKGNTKSGHFAVPRPTHLYSDRAKDIALKEQADELVRYTPDFRNPTLMVGSTAPHKVDFDEWLYELGCLRRHHKDLAFNRMVELGYITQIQANEWLARAEARV